MNKDLIGICLEEAMFDKENQGLVNETVVDDIRDWGDTKGRRYSKTGREISKTTDAIYNTTKDYGINNQSRSSYERAKDNAFKNTAHLDKAGEIGGNLAVGGAGVAAAGGAYLLYKGIKALYNKLKSAKTPEAKEQIKSQIADKKAKLKKAKKK